MCSPKEVVDRADDAAADAGNVGDVAELQRTALVVEIVALLATEDVVNGANDAAANAGDVGDISELERAALVSGVVPTVLVADGGYFQVVPLSGSFKRPDTPSSSRSKKA